MFKDLYEYRITLSEKMNYRTLKQSDMHTQKFLDVNCGNQPSKMASLACKFILNADNAISNVLLKINISMAPFSW